MTQKEFVEAVQETLKRENYKVSQVSLNALVNAVGETIVHCIANGENVRIPYVGNFSAKKRKGSKTVCHFGENIGKVFEVPAKMKPNFSPAKAYTNVCSEMKCEE